VQRRWSWPGPTGKPVYNFRSDGREFTSGRCLIAADGFYEFTKPDDPTKKLKDKWLFTKRDEPVFCIAGIWRRTLQVGEAFTMLTMPPGADVAPYHDRQIAMLDRRQWADWLDPSRCRRSRF
jgi:putative SOS response-associated peptidase YedK